MTEDLFSEIDNKYLSSRTERTMSLTEAGLAPGPDTGTEARRAFVCGVVEGFYGRPWTLGQRKDLFDKMEAWGMTR